MLRTVIFLGAGASNSDGAPLQSELFRCFFEANRNETIQNRYSNSIEYTKKNQRLRDFLRYFFGINSFETASNKEFPTFEEALGVLDLAIRSGEEYRNVAGLLNEYRESLIFALALAIEYGLDYKCSRLDYRNNHQKLGNYVKTIYDTTDRGKVNFISTNYDLLIDNALANLTLPDKRFGPSLAKVHGSLNLLYCPVCKKIDTYRGKKIAITAMTFREPVYCSKCGSLQKAVIVPPTYFKEYSNHYLQQQWRLAERLLTEAKHIVFCGYSFPDADIHVKYLLKKAEINRSQRNTFKISVINRKNNHKY